MGLKAVYDTIDDIPEVHRELYSERNGKFELTGIEGVKTQADVDRLTAGLTKERDAHKATKALVEQFSTLGTLEDIQAALDRIPELEAASKGKLDEEELGRLVEGRLRSKTAPLERELGNVRTKLTAAEETIAKYEARERQRTIHDVVRAAAAKSKVNEHALEDVLLLAERVFELDDTGNVVVKDSVGFTPGISAETWLTEIQPKRPHWWPPSQGGGGKGGSGGGGGGSNPWAKETWNLTEQGRIFRENPERARTLAKQAGRTI